MKAVIVSGSREWEDDAALFAALDAERPDVIIHGDCPTGADAMVDKYAALAATRGRRISVVPVPARPRRGAPEEDDGFTTTLFCLDAEAQCEHWLSGIKPAPLDTEPGDERAVGCWHRRPRQ